MKKHLGIGGNRMKLGLVVEGGASRVYFATGVMDFLLEREIYADYVIGVSAGIADAISYVSRQHGRNIEIGEHYLSDKRYMGMRHLLNPKNRSYYNIDFVFGGITEFVPFDFEAYNNAKCQTVAAVTNIETGKVEYIDISKCGNDWTALVASCALPILFQPIKIGDYLYMDGGIAEPIPVDKAIEEGCDKIIVITSREKGYRKDKESGVGISSLLFRKYPHLVSLLETRVKTYNEAHEKVLEYEKQGKIFLISPDDTKGWKRTERDPQKIRAMHDGGIAKANKLLPRLMEYLEK